MGTLDKIFEDRPITPVRRHWLCSIADCTGEMVATGEGAMHTFKDAWKHRCNVCDRHESADAKYPRIVYI